MKNLFKENGFLSDHGKEQVSGFVKALNNLLEHKMSIAELHALNANLAKIVGDAISDKIQEKMSLTDKFRNMSDDQFYSYLVAKYGPNYKRMSLTDEEYERLPTIKLNVADWG